MVAVAVAGTVTVTAMAMAIVIAMVMETVAVTVTVTDIVGAGLLANPVRHSPFMRLEKIGSPASRLLQGNTSVQLRWW
jgi:hypothetical protein